MPIDPGQVQWDAPPQKTGGGIILTDPSVQADEARKSAAEARANRAEGRAEGAEARAQESSDRGTEAQGNASVLLSRIKGGFSDILEVTARSPQSQEPGILESIRGGLSPVGVGGLVTRKLSDADRRIVADSQVDVLDALLTLGTGAAYNREQLEGQLSSYFPQYGDTPAEIEVKNRRLRRQIEAAKLQAGPLADDLDAAIAPYLGKVGLPGPTGTAPTTAASAGDQTLSEKDLELKAALEDAISRKASPSELSALAGQYGQSITPEALDAYEKAGRIGTARVTPTGGEASTVLGVDPNSATGAYFVGAANALTSGALDEIAPALGMDSKQVQRAKEILREKYPVASFAGEVTGQTLQMAGATKALGAAGMAAPKAAAVAEIGGGAAYGAGESNDGRVGGALMGTGAAVAGRAVAAKIFGTAEKEAIAASAEKAGVPPEAMEQVLSEVMQEAPLTTQAAEEIGAIAKQAIGRGKPARDAKKKLAEMAKINPEAKAAAERMGVDLPLDILSDDAQLKTITGLARSQIGSEAGASWRETVTRTSQQADQVLEGLGATPDLAQVGADVSERINGAMLSLENQAEALRSEVDDAIDVRAPVDAQNLQSVLGKIINDFGGLADAKQAFSGEEKKLLAMLGEGETAKMPTYARLNNLRDEIGRALFKGQGPWADTSQRNLSRYYKALADDQLAHVESVGGADLADKFKGSNTLFSKMYDSRKELQALFGEKLEKDIAPLINRAVTKAGKGDAQDLRKLLNNVPEDMRGGVLMSGLMAQSTSRSAQGGFSFAQYAKIYRGLRQNAPIYKEFAEAIGPQGSQILTDLYAISRRLAEGDSRIVRTGASNQPILNALNAESLVSKVMDGAVRRGVEAGISVGTGGLAGRSVAGVIGESVQNAVQGSSKSSLEKVHGLLSSDAFRELVEKSATGQDTKRSVNRLIGSKEYNNYAARVLGLKTPDQRRLWLQEVLSASSVVGAERTTAAAPAMISIEVPQ